MFKDRLEKIVELAHAAGVNPEDLSVSYDFENGITTLYYKDEEVTQVTGVTQTNYWAADIYLFEYVVRHAEDFNAS